MVHGTNPTSDNTSFWRESDYSHPPFALAASFVCLVSSLNILGHCANSELGLRAIESWVIDGDVHLTVLIALLPRYEDRRRLGKKQNQRRAVCDRSLSLHSDWVKKKTNNVPEKHLIVTIMPQGLLFKNKSLLQPR